MTSMDNPPQLDSYTCKLQGRNLVEAAAGTGKTYNIQILYTRMILELGLPVDSIVVVTFTVAATAELKSRIRTILSEVQQQAEVGNDSSGKWSWPAESESDADAAVQRARKILENATENDVAPDLCRKRLSAALQSFDIARISTIDGFCQRLLGEFAFEGGVRYAMNIVQNPDKIIAELTSDFCRTLLYNTKLNSNGKLAGTLHDACADEEQILSFVKYCYNHPDVILLQNGTAATEAPATAQAPATTQDVEVKVEEYTKDWEKKLGTLLSSESIDNNEIRLTVLLAARQHVLDQFNLRRQRDGFTTFTENLQQTSRAIQSNPLWVEKLQSRFQAVIIDEFQDTNLTQYNIFNTIFSKQEMPFFMVGDPKQAIYAFRGGDVNAYLRAKNDTKKSGTVSSLTQNFRSGQNVIDCIYQLFQNNGFGREDIQLPKITAADSNAKLDLKFPEDNREAKAATLVKVKVKDGTSEPADVVLLVQNLLGNEGYKLVDASGEPRPICPRDIAILCFSNRTCTELYNQLVSKGIPAVLSNAQNVLLSDEAQDFEDLIYALLHPTDWQAQIRALRSGLCNISIDELCLLQNGDSKATDLPQQLRQLAAIWQEQSFMAMFNRLLNTSKFHIFAPRTGNNTTERRLTNYFHLADLLQAMIQRQHLTPTSLLSTYQRMRIQAQGQEEFSEEYELQLASEAEAVRILTIHKSKGLQYPIVILPDLDQEVVKREAKPNCKSPKQRPSGFHKGNDGKLYYHTGCTVSDDARQRCEAEAVQEMRRVIYVAFTRAQNGVFLLEHPVKQETPSPMQVMRGAAKEAMTEAAADATAPVGTAADATVSDATTPVGTASDATASAALGTMPAPMSAPVGAPTPSANAEKDALTQPDDCSQLPLDRSGAFSSFSALAGSLHNRRPTNSLAELQEDDDVAADDDATADAAKSAPSPVFQVPRGAEIGTMLHKILEIIDFTTIKEEDLEPLLTRAIASAGLTAKFTPEAKVGLQQIFAALLKTKFALHDGTPFTLADIPKSHRLAELDFISYEDNGLPLKELRNILEADESCGLPSLLTSAGLAPENFLRGQIDLLAKINDKFFLFDWKSNVIDCNLDSFAPVRNGMKRPADGTEYTGIQAEMQAHAYQLQYLIYLAVTMRHLKINTEEEYNQLFGGVYYVFLRGLKADSDRGLFFDRPSWKVVQAIMEL